MRFLSLICLFALLMGCAPQRHLDRFLDRHPELAIQDTLLVDHETIIESVRHDTMFSIERFFTSDTMIIQKERLRVILVPDTINNTVFIQAECEGDTIRETIRVPYTKYEYREPGWWKDNWLNIIIVLAILAIIYKLFFKK